MKRTGAFVACMALALAASAGCSLGFGTQIRPRPFDAAMWKQRPYVHGDNTRWEMVEDLDHRLLIEGRTTRHEVVALLGEPNSASSFGETGEITYCVGDDGIDPVLLYVEFDAKERVRSVRLEFS